MKLAGKTAVVTGAASGMGKAIAEMFAAEGANVIVADLNEEGAKETAEIISSNGGKAVGCKTNVADVSEVEAMIDLAVSQYGTLDILVNNAGIMDGFEAAGDITDEKWDMVFDVNTKSVMMSTRKALKVFLEKEKGVIINIASTGGMNGAHAGAAYVASKHAVVGFTKNTGFMYAEKGIRCNAIAPGAVNTNISASMKDISEFGMGRAGKTHGLVPRAGEAEEVAKVALFLASDDASFVNGTVVTADAGWTAGF
ncbi:SDR family oxidoreductase [Alkalicoccus daliensis]|uniref:NAD(P)-dependent dehydrogenase, short-chain alcohol dehydrogenase family n=1 Tax=Alkalicoccus daliensis TaxID=745820 RepID=A0A1H0HHB4_9BACI|nr:SDR family oxidoreductase [Alkalicoccus daliensis]SDO18585.1 NAD(P)-dependent dehydrogenase, short-chain alcohol dehydrogenase family [Alkalicoccus daliensis]